MVLESGSQLKLTTSCAAVRGKRPSLLITQSEAGDDPCRNANEAPSGDQAGARGDKVSRAGKEVVKVSVSFSDVIDAGVAGLGPEVAVEEDTVEFVGRDGMRTCICPSSVSAAMPRLARGSKCPCMGRVGGSSELSANTICCPSFLQAIV